MSERKQTRIFMLGLVAVTLLAYGNSFGGQYFLDDYGCVIGNETIGQLWPAAEEIPHGLQRRHIGRLSLWLNYKIGGLDPFGYHVVNLLIHLSVGLLLFDLVRRTLRLPGVDARLQRSSGPLAFAIALFWLVHPLQTESVTYVIQRLESLVSFFYLGCLYCVLRGVSARRPAWCLLAVSSFWFGVATKEIIVTAPLVLLLYDRAFLAGSWREVWQKRWGIYLAMAPVVIWMGLVLAGGPSADGRVSAGFQLEEVTPWQYLMTQAGVILHYLKLAVLPLGQCLDYGWPLVDEFADAALPGLLVLGLLGACGFAWSKWPRLAMLGLAFFLVLAPTSSIMPIEDRAFEHRMYLALAAITALVVLASWYVLDRWVPWRLAPALAVVSAASLLVALTVSRNELYCDPIAMWQNVLETAPHNARAHCNLGSAYCRDWQFDRGEPHLRRAVQLDPSDQSYQFRLEKNEMLQKLASQELRVENPETDN